MGSQGTMGADGIVDHRAVIFFDIDNCLYSRSAKVHNLMRELIDRYFEGHLGVSREEAVKLHKDYYQNYGLALEGLVRHHKIDPLDYNSKVDDALPLEGIIKPNPQLRRVLEDFDTSKVKLWLFTNAYVNHGKRVVRLLDVEDCFEGMTYCDYSKMPIICKPHKDMFARAMKEAGVERTEDCYLVDDSYINCAGAVQAGWNAAHLVEEGAPVPGIPACQWQIRTLQEMRKIWPQFFRRPN